MERPITAPMTIQIPTPIQFCIFHSARASRARKSSEKDRANLPERLRVGQTGSPHPLTRERALWSLSE